MKDAIGYLRVSTSEQGRSISHPWRNIEFSQWIGAPSTPGALPLIN
jgi:hypothetical protein